MYYVNVNGKYYRFVDVPGNGNCFYYSVLRHQSLEQRFDKSDSASLRQYLSSVVSTCFRDDEVIQNLFEYEGVNYKNWCKSIETDGRWTSTFDMLIFSYVMKTNVITVGNYLNGFSIQSMKNYFHTINPHLAVNVASKYRRRRYGGCSSSSRRKSMMLKNLVKWVGSRPI